MTDMLEVVVSDGTGKAAAVDGYTVAGKTGTAWKVTENGTYADDSGNRRYMSTFAGFAPADDPRVTVVVVLDEPSVGDAGGGAAAGPVFSEFVGSAMRVLEVAPDVASPERRGAGSVASPERRGAGSVASPERRGAGSGGQAGLVRGVPATIASAPDDVESASPPGEAREVGDGDA